VKDQDVVPMVLVGNKVDLESERQVASSEMCEMAAKWNIPCIETRLSRYR
jgi:GTPase SAR1 family protein